MIIKSAQELKESREKKTEENKSKKTDETMGEGITKVSLCNRWKVDRQEMRMYRGEKEMIIISSYPRSSRQNCVRVRSAQEATWLLDETKKIISMNIINGNSYDNKAEERMEEEDDLVWKTGGWMDDHPAKNGRKADRGDEEENVIRKFCFQLCCLYRQVNFLGFAGENSFGHAFNDDVMIDPLLQL